MSVAANAMISASPAQAAESEGVLTVYDITNDATTGCIKIAQATRPWTGVPATDAKATITDAKWTTTVWKDNTKTKLLHVTHITNTDGGCPTLQDKMPEGWTVVKGRSAQF